MTAKKPSTALAVREPTPKPNGHAAAEKLPVVETLTVSAVLMLAAETATASPKDDPDRPWLHGVFLHSKEGRGRIVGTDGSRMFLASFPLPENPPAWLADGVILSSDAMRARVGMIAKMGGEKPGVVISYGKGQAKATLGDMSGDMLFQTGIQTGTFPNYDQALAMFSKMDEAENMNRDTWQPVGINSVYLKQCGDIAKLLETGLPKEARSKQGMIVRAFNGNGDANAPLLFDFSTWPGALLVIMPAKLASAAIAAETALLLTPALRGTLGALRAHVTRQLMREKDATTAWEREDAQAKARDYQDRITELLKRVPGAAMLEAPEPDLAKVAVRRVKRIAKRIQKRAARAAAAAAVATPAE